MSMPSFPQNGADMTREEALTMIIASIAMEELALSHILNAEGEKLQYIFGTLPDARCCISPQDVLAVNKSVTALVEVVAQNQMLLKNKLDRVLEACPPLCPRDDKPEECPGSCPAPCCQGIWTSPECFHACPCQPGNCPQSCSAPRQPCTSACTSPYQVLSCGKSILRLSSQQNQILWNPNDQLPWRQQSCLGTNIRWERRTPAQIFLNSGKTYAIQYTLTLWAAPPACGQGKILLVQSPAGFFTEALPLNLSMKYLCCGSRTFRYSTVLHPIAGCGFETGISLILDAPKSVCADCAAIEIAEL